MIAMTNLPNLLRKIILSSWTEFATKTRRHEEGLFFGFFRVFRVFRGQICEELSIIT